MSDNGVDSTFLRVTLIPTQIFASEFKKGRSTQLVGPENIFEFEPISDDIVLENCTVYFSLIDREPNLKDPCFIERILYKDKIIQVFFKVRYKGKYNMILKGDKKFKSSNISVTFQYIDSFTALSSYKKKI